MWKTLHNSPPPVNAWTQTLVPDFNKKRSQVSPSSIFPLLPCDYLFIFWVICPGSLLVCLGAVERSRVRKENQTCPLFPKSFWQDVFHPFHFQQCLFLKACASRSFCSHGGHLQRNKPFWEFCCVVALRLHVSAELIDAFPQGNQLSVVHLCSKAFF